MNGDSKREVHWEPYVWRGILGGAIGNVVLMVVVAVYLGVRFGTNRLDVVLVMGVILALAAGAIHGLVVGYVIYKLTRRWSKQPQGASRLAIGFACSLVFSLLKNLTKPAFSSIAFGFVYAILVGGFAGLMARAKNPSPSASISPERA